MISYLVLLMLAVHFVFDFMLQTNWMATNKSKNNLALGSHVGVYTIGMLLLGAILFGPTWTFLLYGLLNGAIHFVVDYITSRCTSYLWNKKDVHNFFVVVGFDQLLHAITLVVTYNLLFK